MIYEFINEHPEYAAARWAGYLKVSRSGYYEWQDRREQSQMNENSYIQLIAKIFEEGEGTYGVDRICGILREQGSKASYKKVKTIMEEQGLQSIHRRRRQRSLTDSSRSRGDDYTNLVRDMEITEPMQVISSDISYIRTAEGFGYLCQVKDIVSGAVLAESMSDDMKADLVLHTISKMSKRWQLPEGCIFHSDRGSQYTSEAVVNLLKTNNLRQSFSRVGRPGDNSWSESFFSNLKKETVHWRHFKSIEEARQVIFAYIEGFYNTRRVQKRLGYHSPLQWLRQWQQKALKTVA